MSAEAGRRPPLSSAERVERDLDIFRAHLRGIDARDLAHSYQLGVSTIYAIFTEQRAQARRLSQENPIDVVEEITAQIDAAISELAAIGAREKGMVRVRAVLGRINALMQKGKWLQAAGVLPREPEQLRVRIDGMQMAQGVIDVLDRNGLLTPKLMREIYAEVGGGDIDADVIEEDPAELPPAG